MYYYTYYSLVYFLRENGEVISSIYEFHKLVNNKLLLNSAEIGGLIKLLKVLVGSLSNMIAEQDHRSGENPEPDRKRHPLGATEWMLEAPLGGRANEMQN